MSAMGHKQTCAMQLTMSAKGQKRTLRSGVTKRVLRLRGPFDARSDLATERAEVDGFGEKRFRAPFQCLALCVGIAISGDHNDRYIGPSGLGLGQEFETRHAR